ncbi:TetR/AcrR family transcriptional regulator [Actinoplanes regularis]|uniref:Transcriptional regulator, TetR family n=1 Tax=Actinoplanes regularis TaxID=52697 RepID=A0A239CQV8_9ACTN|nr:TetR/AcrR family transcriptional regulator [Actinoplanes regularis]GIE88650.1 TetR family transcriptional regulator [Actinoplanes regularis]SNS21884.1 transcriptional regulator, TetR family [Actinoplanes regularis]
MPTRARDRLLDTAERLFYANGIRSVGVERILAESGVGRASLYRHFPGKDDLVVAVLQRRDQAWRQWLREAVERLAPAPADRPLAVFDALAERFARDDFRGCAFINTIVETADPQSMAHLVADKHKRAVIAYVDGLLTGAGHEGHGPLAAQLVMLMDGAIVTALRERTPNAAKLARSTAAGLLSVSRDR